MFLAGDKYVFEYLTTYVEYVRHMRSVCMTLMSIKVLLLLLLINISNMTSVIPFKYNELVLDFWGEVYIPHFVHLHRN